MPDREPAAAARKNPPPDEATQVAAWLVAIAEAVPQSARTVNPDEQAAIAKVAAVFDVTTSRGRQGS